MSRSVPTSKRQRKRNARREHTFSNVQNHFCNSHVCTAAGCYNEKFKGKLDCDHRCHVCDFEWTGQAGATICPKCRTGNATSTSYRSSMEGLTTIGFTAHGAPEVVDAHPGSLKRSTTTTLSKITDDENSPQPSHGMKDVVPPVPLPVNGCDSRVSLRLRKSRGKTFGNQKC